MTERKLWVNQFAMMMAHKSTFELHKPRGQLSRSAQAVSANQSSPEENELGKSLKMDQYYVLMIGLRSIRELLFELLFNLRMIVPAWLLQPLSPKQSFHADGSSAQVAEWSRLRKGGH